MRGGAVDTDSSDEGPPGLEPGGAYDSDDELGELMQRLQFLTERRRVQMEESEESEVDTDPVQLVIGRGFELGWIISEAAATYVMAHLGPGNQHTHATEAAVADHIVHHAAVKPPFVSLSDVWNSEHYAFEDRDDPDYGLPVGKLWVE